jgi:uncharacterized protein YabE (DUF348 family)
MQKKFRKSWLKLDRLRKKRVRHIKVLSRKPQAVPVLTFLVLIVATLVLVVGYGRLHRDAPPVHGTQIVIISHDNEQQIVPSRQPTVGALIKKLNIVINEGDVVEPALNTPINQDEFRINIYRAVPVTIIDGSSRTYTFSAATTPRAIAQQAGANLNPADYVNEAAVTNFVASASVGKEVIIDRSKPIDLNLYGTPVVVNTHATTVAELIKQKGINLAVNDVVTPAPATLLTANSQVFVERHGTKIESVTQTIPMPTQITQDPTLAFGTGAVRQQGSNGSEIITYQDSLQNGVVVGRTPIQTVITQQPVTQIEVEGTSLSGIKGDMALAGISSSDYSFADYIISHESGWCPTKAQGEHSCPVVPDDANTSAGYGLCQATPGYKMASAGSDWATNPVTQLRWCAGYAAGRYGSWAAAYSHWVANHNW